MTGLFFSFSRPPGLSTGYHGRGFSRVFILAGLCASVLTATPAPEISPSETQERLTREIDGWRSRCGDERPRIYFSADSWRTLRTRYDKSTGRERGYFDAVVERARDVASRPLVAYRPPEDFVSEKRSLFTAKAQLWQRPIGDDLVNTSLALALSDDEGMRAKLRETVLAVCTWPGWGDPSASQHLATAHLIRGVAIAYDWHPLIWSEEEKAVIRQSIRQHAGYIATGLSSREFWSMAWKNNHNHVNVAALGLAGLAFLDEIPEAAEWLAASEINFERVMAGNSPDGTTPEGMSYWVYSLNFILQYIEGTRRILGTERLYEAPFLRHAIDYRLHGSTPGFADVLPWGDVGDAANAGFVLHALARQYRSRAGQYLADLFPYRFESGSVMSQVCWSALWRDPALSSEPPDIHDYHFPDADIVTTRSGWTGNDYLLSIKSGINNRNHGKLDVGALALSYGGEWLLTAPRYGLGKNDGSGGFWDRSGRRWTWFSCATESHATLLVNGGNQRHDRQARGVIDAFASEGDWCWTGVDLTNAYSGVKIARREVLHRRGDYMLVFDDVTLDEPGLVEWLAQVPVRAEAAGGSVGVVGKSGSLRLRALFPAGAEFRVRQATSLHYDLPADTLTTYALASRGERIRYVVALLPSAAGAGPVQSLRAEETENGFTMLVRGEGWTDRVLLGADGVRAERVAVDGTKAGFSYDRP